MTADAVQFYLRHRLQIYEWVKLEKRVDDLIRDAVKEGAVDKATKILNGEFGDADVDFYVRNRSLIKEWDSLQAVAGQALHAELLRAAREAGCRATEEKRGWTFARVSSPEFDWLVEQKVEVELGWTKQDLLSTRRGSPFPRIALQLNPHRWNGENRARLIEATRPVAHELGMTRKDKWWVHWRMLGAISESQDLRSYAEACVGKLHLASERFYPMLRDAIAVPGPN